MSALEENEIKSINNIKLKLDVLTPGVWLWSPYDNSVWSPEAKQYLAGVEIANAALKDKSKGYFHRQEDMRFIADSKEDMSFLLKVIEKLQVENRVLQSVILEATQAKHGKHIY